MPVEAWDGLVLTAGRAVSVDPCGLLINGSCTCIPFAGGGSGVSLDWLPPRPVASGLIHWVILHWAHQSYLNDCLRERLFEYYSICLRALKGT